MVDEYQDTNSSQYLWLRLLAQKRKNICCVGDDDQSIYSWRGAEVANILRFERDFPGARIIRLEQNYRSTPQILAAASGVIAQNGGRLGKTLWTEADEGEKVRVIGVWDGPEEARRVGEEIEALERQGVGADQVAILVRASFQTREFEDRFMQIGLPFRIVGGFRFYERAEVRDAVAYLRLINQPADDLAFERIVNVPKRGLGDKAVETIHRVARAEGVPLTLAAARLVETDELTGQARKSLGRFVGDLARWRDMAQTLPHAELARQMLDESGYTAALQAERTSEAAGRLENLQELVRAMEEYETLGAFLEHVSLVMDNEAQSEEAKVTIMTIHAAKGLEFDTVFLAGWEDGVFPLSAHSTRADSLRWRRSAPRLCRDHPRAAALHHSPCRQPARLRPVDQRDPLAFRGRTAARDRERGNDPLGRRKPVARQLVRARRSLRQCRTGLRPWPRLAASHKPGQFRARAHAAGRGQAERGQPGQQGAQRCRRGYACLP